MKKSGLEKYGSKTLEMTAMDSESKGTPINSETARVQTRQRVFSFSHLNVFDGKHQYSDPGNHEPEHFKQHMTMFRFACRQTLLTLIEWTRTEKIILWIQANLRNKPMDVFFAFTAIMGSHTFYVVMLPIPRWTGFSVVTRDLVYVIGYSIYLSGHFKDYWCLPRPKSPPVHRITLSDYTTKEYGAPSSHTANATGVSLLVIWYISQLSFDNEFWRILLYMTTASYFFILTFGRIYCGMHGILDISSGMLIGIFCCAVRVFTKHYLNFDKLTIESGLWYPFVSIITGVALLKFHARPIDSCPCIEDSVAFVGVIMGIECSDWLNPKLYGNELYIMPFNYSKLGVTGVALRIIVGILAVLTWKELSKKVIYWFLAQIIGDDRPFTKEELKKQQESDEVRLFTPLADIDVIGRSIVYAGIPATVILVCPILYKLLDIYD
ncbi:unnamed protein product [Kluyveromyces dobzhanskii CBS 2104]|uniref:WGS project CCBQ000000000 data, contig 00058 n=1 Tax=Kluyveromyces dobzhanskii CBS 2104 TaxID=1427455 RepID=A0A0A8LAP0_9SACH|nr:unnamed protein product [Kluyveromyces dobzhanskii CBS 2104]